MPENPPDLSLDYGEGRSPVRRVLLALCGLAVIGAGAYGAYTLFLRGGDDDAPAAARQTAVVTRGNLVSSYSGTGTAQSAVSTRLTFPSAGTVTAVKVALGQEVKSGDEIAVLDAKDAQRKVDSANTSLESARLRLQQLKEPPKPADVAAAQQSVTSANGQLVSAEQSLANARLNLEAALEGPDAAAILTADASVTQAETALANANNSIRTSFISLQNAQRVFCGYTGQDFAKPVVINIVNPPCYQDDIPLSADNMDKIAAFIFRPGDGAPGIEQAVSAANSFLTANSNYVNTKNSITTAELNLLTATEKRRALDEPPEASQILQLEGAIRSSEASIDTARASIVTAKARLDALYAGATSAEIALQEQSVKSAEIAYETALDGVKGLTLRAPFDGVISTLGVAVGDTVGAATVAVTLTNPDRLRVDLTVQEADVRSLKAGQFGIATFEALSGNVYVVKVLGVSTTPTVTQGVANYAVQAQILRAADVQGNAADLQAIAQVLASIGGQTGTIRQGGAQPPGGAQQAGRTPPAGFSPPAGLTPGAGRPGAPASGTPGAGRTPGGGAQGGAQGLQEVLNAPSPTPGMTATVIIALEVKEDVLLLPTTAVRRQGQTSIVNILKDDGTTEARIVTTGGSDATNTAILTGVTEGETVVIGAVGTQATPRAAATARPTPAGGVR